MLSLFEEDVQLSPITTSFKMPVRTGLRAIVACFCAAESPVSVPYRENSHSALLVGGLRSKTSQFLPMHFPAIVPSQSRYTLGFRGACYTLSDYRMISASLGLLRP